MSEICSAKTLSGKKFTQTRISSFFSGCVKSIPLDSKMLKTKLTTPRSRKRLSFPASPRAEEPTTHDTLINIIYTVPKRKLPVPILSEDEDSENESCHPKRQATPQKLEEVSSPKSPLSLQNLNKVKTEKSPSQIVILENVASSSTKSVKDETKKINYEHLRVLQEFFLNIVKSNKLIDLLNENHRKLLTDFFALEKEYKFVCVKLFMWRPIWYNIFKYVKTIGLKMEEAEVVSMYNTLKECNFVETDYMGEDLSTLLNLLSLPAIRELARAFRISNVPRTKGILIAKLLKLSKTQVSLSPHNTEQILKEKIKKKMGFCVRISQNLRQCIYYVYVLNTFTNPYFIDPQDYFKDVSYKNVVFPSYKIEDFSIFYTPLEFSKFADAVKLRCDLDKAIDKKAQDDIYNISSTAYSMLEKLNDEEGNSFDNTREPHLERFTPNAQYVYILSSGSKHIRTSYPDSALIWYEYLLSQNYCKHKRGEWYDNLVMIYAQYMKDYEKAITILINAFKQDKSYFTEIQMQELVHRGKMLNKKSYKLPALYHDEITALSPKSCERDWPQDVLDGKTKSCDEPGRRRLYVHYCENGDVNYLNVEQTALQYYKCVGYPNGEHCEGSLIIASFCLLFWDIIYEQYVKGTFISNLQNAPLDMYSEYFYKNRKKKIDKRLNDIQQNWSDEILQEKIIVTWTLHSHESGLCQLESIVKDPMGLFDVICCIGRRVLTKIFERLVTNYKAYHSGFPDLILWNLQEKKAKFVEVKSENDKLSFKQKLWLNYLMDIGATVAVCHVEPKASKKKFAVKKSGNGGI